MGKKRKLQKSTYNKIQFILNVYVYLNLFNFWEDT